MSALTKEDKKKHLQTIFLTVLLDMVGVGILIPIIPYLFDTVSSYYILPSYISPENRYIWQGLALAIYPLFQFVCAPLLGEVSDHYGRKKILNLCLAGTVFGNALTAIAIMTGNFWLFLLGRAIDGATGGNISIAMASIADVSEPNEKAKNFGMIGAAFGLGFIIGPALGGIISKYFGYAMPFWFSAVLGLINILCVYLFIKETNVHVKEVGFKLHPLQAMQNVIDGFKMPSLRTIFLINLIYASAFAFYTSFAGVYLKERFALDLAHVGYYFAWTGVCIALAQGFFIKKVFAKYKDTHILIVALCMFAIVISIMIASHNFLINIILSPLFALSIGLSNSAISAITSKKADPKIQGRIIGIGASLQALAGTLPQFLAGFVASFFGYIAPLYVTGVLIVIATIYSLKLRQEDLIS